MSAYTFRSSRPDQWVSPRPTRDPARLAAIHGPLRPMRDEPPLFTPLLTGRLTGLLTRLFGLR